MEIRIDPELQRLIPPLTPDEYAQLELNILEEGCRDPLVLWRRGDFDYVLIDGHNRIKICEAHGLQYQTVEREFFGKDAAIRWILTNQLGRRNLKPDDRTLLMGMLYNQTKQQGQRTDLTSCKNCTKSTAKQIGDQFGASERTVKDAGQFAVIVEKVQEEQPEEQHEEILKKARKIQREKKSAKKQAKKEKQDAAIKEIIERAKEVDIKDVCNIYQGGFESVLKSGADCVITDPPYEKQYIPLYEQLAKASKHIPLIAVMCGQTYLPEIYALMCKHLKYRWTLTYLTPGGQAVQQFDAKVNTFWKPVLLFGDSIEWFGDVCKSEPNDNDKRFHEWGQSVSGMTSIIERLTQPGQLICDPFCGAGTTGVAALKLGRRFIGCDIDKANIDTAIARCYEVINNG